MTKRHAPPLQRVASLGAALGLALGFGLGATRGARAATFQFSPVRVNLTARDRAAAITLTNVEDTPLRLEVEAFALTQRPNGKSELVPTTALLVFPELVTIPPHGQRRLRIATTDRPAAREAAYILSIAEIGTFALKKTRGANIALSLEVDLPVFVAPTIGRRAGAIADATVAKRTLSFAVVNTGTVHFIIKDSRVTGLGPDERPVFVSELDGGDVLADGKRDYRVELPTKNCGAIRALTIRVKADEQQLVQTVDVPIGACNS